MNRLRFQLDFLNEQDTATVLSFYQKRIDSASSPEEEETIVKSFGKPERIAAKLRASMVEPDLPSSEKEDADNTEAASAADSAETKKESKEIADSAENSVPDSKEASVSDEDDLIFSRPAVEAKTPEIIHALENPDIKPIYGEKVILPEKADIDEDFTVEPSSDMESGDENAPSQEEVDAAKAKALEKAEEYGRASFGEDEQEPIFSVEEKEPVDNAKADTSVNTEADKEEIPLDFSEPAAESDQEKTDEEKNAQESDFEEEIETQKTPVQLEEGLETPFNEGQEEEEPQEELREYPGILNTIFANSNLSKPLVLVLQTLLVLLFSPLLLIAFVLILCAYVVPTVLISVLSATFALIMVLFIAGGVIELVYGFIKLFQSIPIGLIEIGVGTVLFSVVIAIVGLIYEFLFGVVPKTLKKLTQLFKAALHRARCVIFGGKA